MSYDEYDDDYCNSRDNGGILGLLIVIVLFPLLPYLIIGYELGKAIMDINAFKWGIPLLFGVLMVTVVFKYIDGKRRKYILIFLYTTSLPFMFFLSIIITDNMYLNIIVEESGKFINLFIEWLLSN
jgi:hypothetical protein